METLKEKIKDKNKKKRVSKFVHEEKYKKIKDKKVKEAIILTFF
jgi:hypothetical protein